MKVSFPCLATPTMSTADAGSGSSFVAAGRGSSAKFDIAFFSKVKQNKPKTNGEITIGASSSMEVSQKEKILDILTGSYFGIEKVSEESLALDDIALTLSSFANQRKQKNIPCEDNEKLEFFGNYFLDCVVARYLHDYKVYDPKEINKRIKVTANPNLADIVVKYNLMVDEAIRFLGSQKPTMKLTANAFEAFIGAIHCAEGVGQAREIILDLFVEDLKTFDPEDNYNLHSRQFITSQIQNGCILTKILNGVNSVDKCNCSRYVLTHNDG